MGGWVVGWVGLLGGLDDWGWCGWRKWVGGLDGRTNGQVVDLDESLVGELEEEAGLAHACV